MSKKTFNDVLELLDDPTGIDKATVEIFDKLRVAANTGKISTTHAWAFFSTGGEVPVLKKNPTDTAQVIKEKKDTTAFLKKLNKGNSRCLKALKEKLKSHLLEKQDGFCCYCKRQLYMHGRAINIDHIFPKNPAQGASQTDILKGKSLCFDISNLTLCCIDCNTQKNNKLHIYNPNLQEYSDYIDYRIVLTNKIKIVSYKSNTRPVYCDIGDNLLEVFKLVQYEYRNILATLELDAMLKIIESSIINTEDDEELSMKIREFYNSYIYEITRH